MRLIVIALCSLLIGGGADAAPNSRATEEKLAKSLRNIKNNHLDLALNEVNSVLRINPNYKLAQLVKGDLLMAKAGEINSIGGASHAPGNKIQGLRDEARVRLLRTQTQSKTHNIPSYLLKLNDQQKYALVIDTSRSTLYVYKNVNGKPRYMEDFYITIGKLGTEKVTRGDQRTPIGVYFIQADLPEKHLAPIYGSGAFPLNYPNEWDKIKGRTGSGIWLHGTPKTTYSRPPRASNGCVVLGNNDLNKLAPYLQVGITPVIITNKMVWYHAKDKTKRTALLHQIEKWRRDWASLNTKAYLKYYAHNFTSGNRNYAAWVKHKRAVNSRKSWIKVNLAEVSLFTYPDRPDMVVVEFEQNYTSSNLSDHMKKRQYWLKIHHHWRIIYEGRA
ncbi:MAG: L,D-transpeptidase family protein [Gallionella sp.]